MARRNDLWLQFIDAPHRRVEIINFEPEQNAVAVGLVDGIANSAVMMLDFEIMQLQDKPVAANQPLVFRAAVPALAAKQALIPAARRLDVGNADERLWSHAAILRRT